MKLSESVSQTLVQIIEGVTHAQGAIGESAGAVNPKPVKSRPPGPEIDDYTYYKSAGSYRKIQPVRFDVALTTTEESGKAGGGGVSVGVLSIGGKVTGVETNTSAGRIQFEVDIALPRQGEEEVDAQ